MRWRLAVVLAGVFVVAITLFKACVRAGLFVDDPQVLNETDPDAFCRARCKGTWQSYRHELDGTEHCVCAQNN